MSATTRLSLCLAAAALLIAAPAARAAGLFADQDTDPRFKAKIMKEKAKQNFQQANSFNFMAGQSGSNPQCGSQNIGNVDTGGKIGTAPREVFVFAPNAINIVSGPACK